MVYSCTVDFSSDVVVLCDAVGACALSQLMNVNVMSAMVRIRVFMVLPLCVMKSASKYDDLPDEGRPQWSGNV